MATLTKSALIINPFNPASDLKMIEDRYTGYTSEAMASEISRREEKFSKLEPDTNEYRDLAADIEDFKCVHSMAEEYEATLALSKKLLPAYEVKEELIHTTQQILDALEQAITDDSVDAPYGSFPSEKADSLLPDSVQIEVLGDNLPVKVLADGAILTLKTNDDGIATYSVSMN